VITTAGHCFQGNVGDYDWSAHGTGKGVVNLIGHPSSRSVFNKAGDAGALRISVNSPFFEPQNHAPLVFVTKSVSGSTSRQTNYDIRGVSASVKGRILCLSGSSNGSRCIKVDKLNATFKADGVTTKHMGRAGGCGVTEGDSGGPVYKAHRAYGTITGTSTVKVPLGGHQCHVYYQGAGGAEDLLNVDIAVRR
jgi:hypothetical protein